MTLKCVIIDDEPLAVQLLRSYAEKIPSLELVGVFSSAIEASKTIRSNRIDLAFLDIQMPELSGLEFAKLLPKETKIIFTTAFNQYAIEGYKVDAIDYLLKPISFEDFTQTINKVISKFQEEKSLPLEHSDRFIYIKSDYKLLQLRYDDILYVEGEKDYVKFYLEGQTKPITSLMNLKKVEERLPSPEFMRIHRSYIVHMSKVKTVDRYRFVFGDKFIPVSSSYKDEVDAFLNGHLLS